MLIFDPTPRLLVTVATVLRLPTIAACICLLTACRAELPPTQILAQCVSVGGVPEQQLTIEAPPTGWLVVSVEERGVALSASLDGGQVGAASSPVDRLGRMVLITPSSTPAHRLSLRIEDSADVRGSACVTAHSLQNQQRQQLPADSAFAAAGRATHAGQWEAAFESYLEAARRFDRLGMTFWSAAARQAMAEIAYLRLDRKRDSLTLASQARAEYRDRADSANLGALLSLEGKALLDLPGSDLQTVTQRARELFGAARRYELSSPYGAREVPRLDIMLGFLAYRLNERAQALEVFAAAARSCHRLRDWDCYAMANQNLATLAADGNNYSVAMSAFADALRALPPELDPKLSADIWDNYGHVQGLAGLFSSAERSHRTALRGYARLGDCPGVRRSLAWSGTLLVQVGTLRDAEDSLQQAASQDCPALLADNAATPPTTPGAPDRPPRHVAAAGPAGVCERPLDAAALAFENKMIVFNSLLSLGSAMMLEGRPSVAARCVAAAASYAATPRARMRLANAQGDLLLERNDTAAARADFELSLRIADEAHIPAKFEHRGTAQLGLVRTELLAGHAKEALAQADRALALSVGQGNIEQTVASLRLMGSALRAGGREAEAVHTLQVAADLIEAVPIDELDGEKRATFLATQHDLFAELAELYASQAATQSDKAWAAFETSERGRARSLRFAITQQTRDVTQPVDSSEAQYKQLLHAVAGLAQSAGSSGLIAALDQAALRQRQPSPPLAAAQLDHTLELLDGTLVEYVAGLRDLFAIVINHDQTSVVRLGARDEISNLASSLQDLLRDPETPLDEQRTAARQLASLILWPLRGQLRGHRVIFVPDEALHTIPFGVLPWSAGASEQLLVNHLEISTVPSALFLDRAQSSSKPRTAAPRIALIGDPIYRIPDWHRQCEEQPVEKAGWRASRSMQDWTDSLPRLPGSRAEVHMIAQVARQERPGSQIETLLGCAAVPSALKRATQGPIDLLHIATHSRVDAQRPRLSALALTPEGADGGTTSSFGLLDILGLKLNSTLVVLSACDTSRGRLLPGEGVLGPAQAFLQAGASAVLASYWRVEDQSAADFMQRFYHYLLADHLRASSALRHAQLDEAAAHAPAHDWAAFALYGWPDSSL